MKAILCTQYGPPEVLQIREVDQPVPGDNEVLIRIRATTVTAADFRVRSFTIPLAFRIPARLMLGFRKPRNPILGVELAGEIERTGKSVTRFKQGDQVFACTLMGFGAYAEYICLPEDGVLALKPANSTYEAAAALPVGTRTALHYLRKGKVRSGQKVLIYGASGSVGTYAVQLARHFGAEVTGVCSGANLEMVKALGADHVIDYTTPSFMRQLEQYDVIFVAVDKFPFAICNQLLNPDGVYLNVTAPVRSLRMLWTSVTTRKTIIVGHNPPEKAEDLVFIKELVEAGALRAVIDKSYPFEEMVAAHRYVDQGHKKGNVVILV